MTPWTVACQAPLAAEFSRLEYWSGLPFSTPDELPDPGIERVSLSSSCSDRWILYHFATQASLLSQMVKNLLAIPEIWVRSLCWEDPLEKRMATHSSILAWGILSIEEPGGLQSMESQRVGDD